MYERFTDRARKVMQLATQEAQRFNHEYVGTEHLLLGLIKEGSGIAANVLVNLGVDIRRVRLLVEELVQPGPDMVQMGKLPQTPRTKKAIEYAMEEARSLNHNHVGTEHLLLGMLREKEGVAAAVFQRLHVTVEAVREQCMTFLGVDLRESEETADSRLYRVRLKSTFGSIYLVTVASDPNDAINTVKESLGDWVGVVEKTVERVLVNKRGILFTYHESHMPGK